MFKDLQDRIYTPEKFYKVFLKSEQGKVAFTAAYQKNYLPNNVTLFVNDILIAMQDWLFEQLTDDEMNAADTLFVSLEPDLKQLIINSIQ